MSAQPAAGRGLLAAALARAEGFLLEPAVPLEEAAAAELSPRPVILVAGLGPGCGATTVGRALAAELAARDPGGAAAVGVAGGGGQPALRTHSAGRLARTLSNLADARPRSIGRLCVVDGADPGVLAEAVRYLAPLVLDPGSEGGLEVAAALADRAVLVAGPDVEPALAAVAAQSLGGGRRAPLVVVNRAADTSAWEDRADLLLPESRMAAALALGGREPCGGFGRAIRTLADRCEEGT